MGKNSEHDITKNMLKYINENKNILTEDSSEDKEKINALFTNEDGSDDESKIRGLCKNVESKKITPLKDDQGNIKDVNWELEIKIDGVLIGTVYLTSEMSIPMIYFENNNSGRTNITTDLLENITGLYNFHNSWRENFKNKIIKLNKS